MDENVSRAVIFAGGILVSVAIVSLLTFAFSKFGVWTEKQDDEVEIEQTEKFNKEYEAYDKDLMYGVDVLSCMGKAKSNNDKTQEDYKYGDKLSSDYAVQVEVEMNSDTLTETINVWKVQNGNSTKPSLIELTTRVEPVTTLSSAGFNFPSGGEETSFATSFKGDGYLEPGSNDIKIEGKKYELSADSTDDSTAVKLLNSVTYMSQVVTNSNPATQDKWAKAEYRSIAYDFKSKKFKCTGITYKSKNGRIDTISFKEL